MSRRRVPFAATGIAALAATALGGTVQVTQSPADSRLERIAVVTPGRWAAVRSAGDLTPGDPGNADGNAEIWRLDLFTGDLLQATDSGGTVRCPRATINGNLILSSQEDLTPGAPGNADGSYEAWFFDAATRALVQMTASAEDSFFQTARPLGRPALVDSKGDLVPGGNTDGNYEVYAYDLVTHVLTQVTTTDRATLIRGMCGRDVDCAIVESQADLAPAAEGGLGNADGSREVYLVDVATGAVQQLTASGSDAHFVGLNDDGRFVAVESTGDLVPGGNLDGSNEVYVWGVFPDRLIQVTSSAGDSHFGAFVPHSRFVAVTSRESLVRNGNDDGSQEVFLADLKSDFVRQLTSSSGDSEILDVGAAPGRWAVIRSTGDLRPDVPGGGAGTRDLYLQRLRPHGRTRPVRLTSGDDAAHSGGFGPRARRLAIDTTGDVGGRANADGSREVWLVAFRGNRAVPRMLTSTAGDSEVAAVSRGHPLVVVESSGDLVPGGNTDGSVEVYVHTYGRIPRRAYR